MILKKFLEENNFTRYIFSYFAVTLISFVFFTIISFLMLPLFFEVDWSNLSVFLNDYSNSSSISALKFLQFFSCIGLFILPPFLFGYISDEKLDLNMKIDRRSVFLAIAIIILINPFVSYTYLLNQSIDLPQWMLFNDQNAQVITEAFLVMNSFPDLFINMLILAILPAIGEELVFRGFLQKRLILFSKNPHLSIIIVAFIFSAIHMQFQGFLPRFFLGLVLGYFFHFSSNIWLPIIGHFINNSLIVLLSFPALASKINIDLLNMDKLITIEQALFSLSAAIVLFYLLKNNLENKLDKI